MHLYSTFVPFLLALIVITHEFLAALAFHHWISIHQTVLRERINATNVKMECWQKVLSNKSATECLPARLYYQVQVGESDVSVCLSSFRNLFGLFQRQWVNLKKSIDSNYKPGPLVHGNIGTHHRSGSSKATI